MVKELTFSSILCNALNQDYSSDQAVDDLSKLLNEMALMEIQGELGSARFGELKSLIHVQKKLAKAKLDGHPIFEQLGTLAAIPHKDD